MRVAYLLFGFCQTFNYGKNLENFSVFQRVNFTFFVKTILQVKGGCFFSSDEQFNALLQIVFILSPFHWDINALFICDARNKENKMTNSKL